MFRRGGQMVGIDSSGDSDAGQGAAGKLTPEMASFPLLVHGFVRGYIEANGECPSYGEIANRFGTYRQRAKRAMLSLGRRGLLVRTGGTRGWRLPTEQEEAIRALRKAGWAVDPEGRAAARVTKPSLLPTPELDYLPDDGTGEKGQRTGPRAR